MYNRRLQTLADDDPESWWFSVSGDSQTPDFGLEKCSIVQEVCIQFESQYLHYNSLLEDL